MPIIKTGFRCIGRSPEQLSFKRGRRRIPHAPRELDTSSRLIAPAHTFVLPSLEGIKDRFEFSSGFESVVPIARALITKALMHERHLAGASSPVAALEKTLSEIVNNAFRDICDRFGITLTIADRLEDHRKPESALFFVWANSTDPQYIALRPIFEKLEGNPHRDRLMASLYRWLYCAASRVFTTFGLDEAQKMYAWRREAYTEARESGDDVDLEGEVEYADPIKVVSYIRESDKLKLKRSEAAAATSSISNKPLRSAFERAYRIYTSSRSIKLPIMSEECQGIVEDAAYYFDGDPVPGLGVSHWRDDPIVAWFDQFCQHQFESGVTGRAPMIICFHPDDQKRFLQLADALPRMVNTIAGLSEWVRFAEEVENAGDYRDR
jgi:hypothetical protein